MEEDRLETITNNPWWDNVDGPFRVWDGPVGCKADGGGCTRHHGLVGRMVVWRAVHNRDVEGIILGTGSSILFLTPCSTNSIGQMLRSDMHHYTFIGAVCCPSSHVSPHQNVI